MKECGIVRDLLPLYQEGALRPDSVELVEEHLKTCPDCRAEREKLRKSADCGIVRDLLPLYQEGMLGRDSVEFVERHLARCPDCQAEREKLRGEAVPEETPELPEPGLEKVRRKLLFQRLRTVALAVCLALALATAAFAQLTERHYFSDPEGVLKVADRTNGWVVIQLSKEVTGAQWSCQETGGREVWYLSVWQTTWDRLFGGEQTEERRLFRRGEAAAIYLSPNDGSDDILLWGQNQAPRGGIITLPRLALAYYAVLALAALAVLGIAAFALRRRKIGPWLRALALLPAAYLLGELLVKGFTTVTYSMERDFSLIVAAAIFLYPVLWLGLDWLRERRRLALPKDF